MSRPWLVTAWTAVSAAVLSTPFDPLLRHEQALVPYYVVLVVAAYGCLYATVTPHKGKNTKH